jgi:DNA mismatch repair protein MSH6
MLKTMISQVKPMEVIYDPDNLSKEVQGIFKKGYLKPVLSSLKDKKRDWSLEMAVNILE